MPFDLERPDGATRIYRTYMNSTGSPSDLVAAGYIWMPGTELTRKAPATALGASALI